MPHDFFYHGTSTLFAPLHLAIGEILTQCKPSHRHQEFPSFLDQIEKSIPSASTIIGSSIIVVYINKQGYEKGWQSADISMFILRSFMYFASPRLDAGFEPSLSERSVVEASPVARSWSPKLSSLLLGRKTKASFV